MDDPNLEDYNVDYIADQIVADINQRTKIYATDQILFTVRSINGRAISLKLTQIC
jgi:hypothetical protein